MITNFKLKTQRTQGVDIESPALQAAEVASLIGATSFSVNMAEGTASFVVAEVDQPITVKAGQVISVTLGAISVQDRAEFYALFEADNIGS